MLILLTFVVATLLLIAWLLIYTYMGIIPKKTWGKLWKRLLGDSEHTTYSTKARKFDKSVEPEDEDVFHEVFDLMDVMNVREVESFRAYGKRTFYFTCGKCGQKNRLGTDLKKFNSAGCGKCHAKFARRPVDARAN
jgi:hypothetical protein